VIVEESESLRHYGIKRRSGRYPWGSGDDPVQRSDTFLSMVADLRKKGMSDTQIAKGFGMTTTELRATNAIARNEKKQADISRATALKDKGYSNIAIGKKMGINESSVRALLAPGVKDRADILMTTSNMLKDQVDSKGFIDIGTGVEHHVGVSRTKLDIAVAVLKEQGYEVHTIVVDQVGTGLKTKVKVLAPPGTTYRDIASNREKIQQINAYSETGGRSYSHILPPKSVSSKRIGIRYAEDGGTDADGVIYVRPGVEDLSLGKSRYAQVRVAVDGTHYLKGMAMYKDDLPDGVDLVFNTNKSKTGNKLDAMKALKDDPENPFGSIVRQIGDKNERGEIVKLTSAMNLVNEQGDWDKWSKSLSSQMLSKQTPKLAKTQLDMTYERRKNELDQIMRLTNPVVRKRLLDSFAEDSDSAAVHLKAAGLPRQRTQVILPINSLKETEIYAPNFKNGENVVLIRFPHGGIFEIPELKVNNRHAEAKRLLGNAPDAVGIHSKVAERLSGADFDGDTVLVIPNVGGSIKTKPALAALKDFDPQRLYKNPEGVEFKGNKQRLMGDVSNLITDMTIKGANDQELARAVKHSMVVIDAEKHNLNYKQSAVDNGIGALKTKYQGRSNAGASTIVSRKGSVVRVPERKVRTANTGANTDPLTGRKVFQETGATYIDRNGKTIVKTSKVKKLAEVDDARDLSSGTPIETVYANHSNRLKALANEARKASVNTPPIKTSKSAKEVYNTEVKRLTHALNIAKANRPLERQAQLIANANISLKRKANPDMDQAELKKLKGIEIRNARTKVGAKKELIEITDREWEAIQAGAIPHSKLIDILNNTDLERVKQLATPKVPVVMTATKKTRALQMLSNGYTQAEVAAQLGVSLTTLKTEIA
jgi:DNA-binding CsgD family transcriptional regulator